LCFGWRNELRCACGAFTISAGAEHDHELLRSQGLLSADAWGAIKAACVYIDVLDNLQAQRSDRGARCRDVVLGFASEYDVIICDVALVADE
jgi:hypothetical protein